MKKSFCNVGMPIRAILLIVGVLLSAMPLQARAFPVPERLEFEISYSGVTAGRAVQEVIRDGDELHIISTAKSANWLRIFFPVNDRVESIVTTGSPDQPIGMPRLYRMLIHEGHTHFNREAIFNHRTLEVRTRDNENNSESILPITERTYDTLSSFFYLRTIPLQVGTSHLIDIFDCKKLLNTKVKILRREIVETPLGRFKTVVIEPMLKSEGIFNRTGAMLIWLTDDERHIPILMKSKVKIGSITATLVGGSYWASGKK